MYGLIKIRIILIMDVGVKHMFKALKTYKSNVFYRYHRKKYYFCVIL